MILEIPETKKRPGRPAANPCPAAWLDHLRQWCGAAGEHNLTRFETVPWGRYEKLLKLRPNLLYYWFHEKPLVAGRAPAAPARTDYLRLCPLLAAWHGYEPPCSDWLLI